MELGINTGKKAELRMGQMELVKNAWAARRDAEAAASAD